MTRRLLTTTATPLPVGGVAGSASADTRAAQPAHVAAASVQVADGGTAGAAVVDRQTGTFTE
ncbi:hypothetical protein [Streptomyces sp. Y7]|uniref:hypothetical protein n=1 Tax=Streptomyces sp. Y7 TaxID=3342392 RepID=UPI00371CDACF